MSYLCQVWSVMLEPFCLQQKSADEFIKKSLPLLTYSSYCPFFSLHSPSKRRTNQSKTTILTAASLWIIQIKSKMVLFTNGRLFKIESNTALLCSLSLSYNIYIYISDRVYINVHACSYIYQWMCLYILVQ